MSLLEHLGELRRRVMWTAAALMVATVVVFVVFNHILAVLLEPYCHVVGAHQNCALYVTSPLDGLGIRVKVAAYGGALLASPIALWNLWQFVVPGLTSRERSYALPFVTSSVTLFAAGAAIAYVTFPHALGWLHSIGGPSLTAIYSPSSYLGLLVVMMAVFGLTFELPVLLVFLQISRVVTPKQLASKRRFAIVGLVAFAAIITPSSDPFSMLALALPLVALYEVAIVIGRIVSPMRRARPTP